MKETDSPAARIARKDIDALFAALKAEGYALVGPTVRDEVIVFDDIDGADDLPIGWRDEQEAGTYRLKRRDDSALFGYNVGPHSWKKFLFPPREKLWSAEKMPHAIVFNPEPSDAPQYAFIGVRACDIHAIRTQDKVFMNEYHANPRYTARREKAFILAVNCGQAAKTCFCTSMNTGPKVEDGFDLALTEIINGDDHYFVVEAGTEQGKAILDQIPHRTATENDLKSAAACTENAKREMGRTLDTTNIKDLLYNNYENPRWEIVAERCLTCANCTMVCPTCFCSTVEDTTDLTGDHAERWQTWDSCFTMDFTHLHGAGSVRHSAKSRYRQWMTHKLGTWIDQFGTSGCVGCGRCIAWCPVGIDITEELAAIRESDGEKND